MKDTTVSIAEGKKGFSRLIQGAIDKKGKIIVTDPYTPPSFRQVRNSKILV